MRCEIYDIPATIVTTNPASAVRSPGATHRFTAAHTGCATNLQWFKHNIGIPGASDHTLTLENVTTTSLFFRSRN